MYSMRVERKYLPAKMCNYDIICIGCSRFGNQHPLGGYIISTRYDLFILSRILEYNCYLNSAASGGISWQWYLCSLDRVPNPSVWVLISLIDILTWSMRRMRVLGYSIKELCLVDSDDQLKRTDYTQPALYVVDSLSYLAKVEDEKIRPDFVIGHSLGEYAALYAAGAFDFTVGLKLVRKRGALMNAATGGGMAAITGHEG